MQIVYVLRSSLKARRMQIKITKDRKLEVVVPHRIDISEGERFLSANRIWVAKHLEHLSPKEKQFLYLGKSFKAIHTHNPETKKYRCRFEDDLVHIESPAHSTLPPHDIFMRLMRINAKEMLPVRCMELAGKYGFNVKKISVRGQKSRWGSCSRRGNISLNYKLLQMRAEMIDYVIIHELCHLRHPNHSKSFWTEVGKYVPGYKALDKELNRFRI
jgi:predicted metal-dependent hydrolase